MKPKQTRRVPEEDAATLEEINTAIESLTSKDWARLKYFADTLIYLWGPGATSDDLINTALLSLLEDTRRWNKKKVGFVRFLTEAMRSISSNQARHHKTVKPPILEADIVTESKEGETFNPLENLQDQISNTEKQLIDRERLLQIEDLFKDDENAQMVLTAWQEGYDPREVRNLWSLSQKEYNTIIRRIRRKLRSADITSN